MDATTKARVSTAGPEPMWRALPFILPGLVLAWPWTRLPMNYMVNDDLGIVALLSHGFDPVFFSVLLGKPLIAAYRVFGVDAPVYPLFLNACLALCAGAFGHCVVGLRARGWGVAPLLAVLAVYGAVLSRFCMFITFTMVAAAVAAHGLLWLLTGSRRSSAVLSGTLLGLGALIRFEAAAMTVVLFCVPALCWLAAQQTQLRRAMLAAIPLLVLLGSEQAVAHLGVSDAYRSFAKFNAVRGLVHGFPILEAQRGNQTLLRANGWSETDFELFASWSFPDERKYNVETISRLLTLPAPASVQNGSNPATPVAGVQRLLADHSQYALAFWLILLLSLALPPWRRTVAGVAHALVFLGLGLALETWFRFPLRVGEAAMLGALLGMLALAALAKNTREAPYSRGQATLATSALIAFALWRGVAELTEGVIVSGRQSLRLAQLRHLDAHYAHRILYLWPSLPPPQQLQHPVRSVPLHFDVMFYGWTTFSPYFYADIRRLLGVERGAALWPALARRKDVVFVAPLSGMRLIEQTLKESYQLTAQSTLLETYEGASYWRLTLVEPP